MEDREKGNMALRTKNDGVHLAQLSIDHSYTHSCPDPQGRKV